jgi:putative ABC transport system permease protein
MEDLPGVQSVSVSSNTPLNNRPNPSDELIIEGRPPLEPGERQPTDLVVVSSNYFATIGARLLSGRDFSESDGWESSPVAIISEAAAARYWPGEDPLGKRIRRSAASDQRWLTIIGIVSDLKQAWFDREIRPQLYLPYLQSPRATMAFLLRVADDPISLISSVRTQIFAIDRDQPIEDIKTLSQLFVDETSPFRFAAVLISVFGGIALVLSAVGVYGVISYSVAQRTHEIGVRIALGASRKDVLRLVVGQGLKTAALGLAVGFPLAIALSRIMVNQLFGVVSLEYGVMIGLMMLLGAVAILSSYIPALRATKVDPIVALHQD